MRARLSRLRGTSLRCFSTQGSSFSRIGKVERHIMTGIAVVAAGTFLYVNYITRDIPLPYYALPSFSRGLRAYKVADDLSQDPGVAKSSALLGHLRDKYLEAENEFAQCYKAAMEWDAGCLGLVLVLEKLSSIHTALASLRTTTKEERQFLRKQAEEEYLSTMEVLVQHQGRMAPTLIRPMVGLSELYSLLGRHKDAQGLLIQCHAISLQQAQKQGNSDMESTGQVSQRLGEAYRLAGKHKEAIEWNKRALSLCEQYLGPNHPENANILAGLCDSLCALNKGDEAKRLAERAVVLTRDSPPEYALSAQYNLARVYLQMGDTDQGKKLLEEVRLTARAQGSRVIENLLRAESAANMKQAAVGA